jgi:hypothetical protein
MKVQPSHKIDFSKLPSRAVIHKFTDELIDLLFPIESTFLFHYEVADEKEERLHKTLKEILKKSKKEKLIIKIIILKLKNNR